MRTHTRASAIGTCVVILLAGGLPCCAEQPDKRPAVAVVPRVLLDTDAKNEVDDQHYIAYGLFSELDIVGINSVHHGGGQEPVNYAEIIHVLDLARQSGVELNRLPPVYRGANERLAVPASGVWSDTKPIITDASNAIVTVAEKATPNRPLWVLSVGPCTNVASAILQARAAGVALTNRLRVVWLGGGPDAIHEKSFNGKNDPWSVYVVGRSGVPCDIVIENPTGASVKLDKRIEEESRLYPTHPLGRYLLEITPSKAKALYDLTTISFVIAETLGKKWVLEVEPTVVLGPADGYRWQKAPLPANATPTNVRLIRDVDEAAMKLDFFNTLNDSPARIQPLKP